MIIEPTTARTRRVNLVDWQSRALQRAVGAGRSTWAVLSLLPPFTHDRLLQRKLYGHSASPRLPGPMDPAPHRPGDVLELAEWWFRRGDGRGEIVTVSTGSNMPSWDDGCWMPPAALASEEVVHRLPVLACRALRFPEDLDPVVADDACAELPLLRQLFCPEPGAWLTHVQLTEATHKVVVPARRPRPTTQVARAVRRPAQIQGSLL